MREDGYSKEQVKPLVTKVVDKITEHKANEKLAELELEKDDEDYTLILERIKSIADSQSKTKSSKKSQKKQIERI